MSFRENIKPKTTDDLIASFARVAQTSHYNVRFEGIEKLAPQCFHGMLLGLGMKDAKREERDNHHDFRNNRHGDKLGISYPSDKREDWKAD